MTSSGQGTIGVVVTGGTIGSELVGEEVRLRTGEEETPPELGSIFAGGGPPLRVMQPFRKLSENIAPPDWVTIAGSIVDLVDNSAVSGVVVLHGTDTAAYTAAALTFLTADVEVPVVITGSNLPASEPDSDAPTNVRDAVVAATHLDSGTYLSFSGVPGQPSSVYLGTDVRKIAPAGQAFGSVKDRPVASVVDGHFTRHRTIKAPRSSGHLREVDDRVLGVTLYPGIDLQLLADAAIRGGIRGVVVELYPAGTGPTTQDSSSLPEFIRRCDDSSIVVVTTASKLHRDHASVYETSVSINEAGALFASSLIFESALAKLMWALAQSQSAERVKRLVLEPTVEEEPGATE